MFKVYIDDHTEKYPLYEPLDDTLTIFNPVLEQEIGMAGSFKFSLPGNHPYGDKISLSKAEIIVYRDEDEIFHGRILKPEYAMDKTISVTCEGDLTYLIDSLQRPYTFTGSVSQFIEQVLTVHNSQVDDYKKIYPGIITVTGTGGQQHFSNDEYSSSQVTLYTKLIDAFGGYFRIRNENGKKYFDYVWDFGAANSQVIRFGENLIDFNRYIDASSIITCLVPVGADLEYTDEIGQKQIKTIDITSVNNGLDYIQSDAAIAIHGKIWGSQKWKDVEDPETLLMKARAYLQEVSALPTAMEVSAIDLSLIEEDIQEFRLGCWTEVSSEVHGIEKQFLLTKRVINLLDPTAGSICLGNTQKSFVEMTVKSQRDAIEKIKSVAESGSLEINRKVENATSLITGGLGGYVVLDVYDPITGEKMHPWRILIMDAPEKETARSVIQINKNGIGFSTTGINGPYRNAWTIDGNLVADFITTGTMLADRIRGGMLEVGGQGLGKDGTITVKNAAGTVIGTWDKTGLHVLLGVIEGTTIRGSAIIGGTIDIGYGTFYVDEDGAVVINSGVINIGNVTITQNYAWINGFGISDSVIYSRDSGNSIQIYANGNSEWGEPHIRLVKGSQKTDIGPNSVTTGLLWVDNDIYFADSWTEGMSLIEMLKDLYRR
ncbi:phage tail spike protein [Lacrimispora indolis]|uniref:phage tail spike protein n=1 Tax=Lacrimispora indolis TaxID=69825 RepID=UPI00040254F1|nr:phage tail spike protein [[Clostridium] methoxybenzovorans]